MNVMGTIWTFCGLVQCYNPSDSFANMIIEGEKFEFVSLCCWLEARRSQRFAQFQNKLDITCKYQFVSMMRRLTKCTRAKDQKVKSSPVYVYIFCVTHIC